MSFAIRPAITPVYLTRSLKERGAVRSWPKAAYAQKKKWKKHLSPSRRRALRPFFVQRSERCKYRLWPGLLRGLLALQRLHAVQGFAKKSKGSCTALRSVEELALGVTLPACKGYDLKNLLHRIFSFSELVAPARNPTPSSPFAKRLKGPACFALRHFLVLHSVTRDLLAINANLHDVKNVEKGLRLGHFSNVGWEKGNFGKRGIEMGYSLCGAWPSVITSRGNFR
ncbi:hypothetical protein [Pseudomonas sp. TNT2022 ID642]|uniref:hypothetical protein n=1 Tax=Pseudomonas sp. TNT2022 ID642 TaxID=2942632 RepID=UPI0023615A58|nr:hypothetical protein [Pseudomonas sp. TNT2022 ID642]MDD1002096.1 hypothetical protein [Pseudomonas sp. TNT2022 ID642]